MQVVRIDFGDVVVDTRTRELTRAGQPVPLSPKAFELLLLLIESRPQAISKRALQDRLWPDTFVVEKNLANLVAEIRRALGDTPSSPRFIRTVQRFGYALRDAAPRIRARLRRDSADVARRGGDPRRWRARRRPHAAGGGVPRGRERVAPSRVDHGDRHVRDDRGSREQERHRDRIPPRHDGGSLRPWRPPPDWRHRGHRPSGWCPPIRPEPSPCPPHRPPGHRDERGRSADRPPGRRALRWPTSLVPR